MGKTINYCHVLSVVTYKRIIPRRDKILEIESVDLFSISFIFYFITHNNLVNDRKKIRTFSSPSISTSL